MPPRTPRLPLPLPDNWKPQAADTCHSCISGPPMLTSSAVDAVKNWRYKPYLLNGDPKEVETTININFAFLSG